MKKIVLSVMAVVPVPMGGDTAARSTRAPAPDPVAPAADESGQGRPAGLPGMLDAHAPVRLARAPTATVRQPS